MSEDATISTADEIFQLTKDALNLANVACHFDKIENYGGAYDYYDKCILNIDEVMSKLPPTSAQWHQLNVTRAQYDDRMETLREIEANRNSFFRSSDTSNNRNTRESSTGSSGGSSGGGSKFGFRKKALSQDDLHFTEIDIATQFTYEAPPASITEIPYWILRNIKRSIVSGGYITEAVFVPKPVWTQTDVKFAGIPAKTAAFEIILRLIASMENLHIAGDDISLNPLEIALHSAQEELLSLQNQLSKPFPYIKEIDSSLAVSSRGTSVHGMPGGNDELASPAAPVANSSSSTNIVSGEVTVNSGGIAMDNDDNNTSRDSVSTRSSNVTNSNNNNNSSGRTFSSFVSALSKGVRKYAEVSFHRLAVALPSKLTAEEQYDYTQLIIRVCDKSQIFAQWFRQMIDIRTTITAAMSDNAYNNNKAVGNNPVMLQYKADNILQSLIVISGILRDVFCEILLRDVEYLLERYLIKTRKSFSRMYWDQDQNSETTS